MEAKFHKTSSPHFFCRKETKDWFLLWLNIKSILPFSIDCFVDNFKLRWDPIKKIAVNNTGVQVRVPHFGTVDGVEYLDTLHIGETEYFHQIIDTLVNVRGYTRNVDIFGAPYDFRLSSKQLSDTYIVQLKNLVEQSYKQSGGQKVVLIAHSYGNLQAWDLLRQQTQQWKDMYIDKFISLAAPWLGSIKSLQALVSGDNLDIFFISSLAARKSQRTEPSVYALLPNENMFGQNATNVVVQTAQRNYTLSDLKQLVTDLQIKHGMDLLSTFRHEYAEVASTPPGVEVYCFYGTGEMTAKSFQYPQGKFPNNDPITLYGDGDGTVNVESA